jgi:hypothetical protein
VSKSCSTTRWSSRKAIITSSSLERVNESIIRGIFAGKIMTILSEGRPKESY